MSVQFIDGGAFAIYEPGNGHSFRYTRTDGTYYHDETPEDVVRILESVRKSGQRIRIHYGDTEAGSDWLDEYDVTGTIGRSMGPLRVPLMIHNARSMGGPALLDNCIVRIRTTGKNGRDLYRHPKYDQGAASIVEIGPDEACVRRSGEPPATLRSLGYTHSVHVNGKAHANFKGLAAAERWVKKMGMSVTPSNGVPSPTR